MPNRTLPAWLWTAFLLVLCLLPRHLTPERSPVPLSANLPHLDKLVHVGLFAVFGLLWARALAPARRGWSVFAIGAMLAVGTELAQGLVVVDRDPDVLDALADLAGLGAGIVCYGVAARVPGFRQGTSNSSPGGGATGPGSTSAQAATRLPSASVPINLKTSGPPSRAQAGM